MSYGVKFTKRATAQLRNLNLWLQEETLDEIDRIAKTPPPELQKTSNPYILDVVRDRGGHRLYVLVTVALHAPSRVLIISEIGFYARPSSWTK